MAVHWLNHTTLLEIRHALVASLTSQILELVHLLQLNLVLSSKVEDAQWIAVVVFIVSQIRIFYRSLKVALQFMHNPIEMLCAKRSTTFLEIRRAPVATLTSQILKLVHLLQLNLVLISKVEDAQWIAVVVFIVSQIRIFYLSLKIALQLMHKPIEMLCATRCCPQRRARRWSLLLLRLLRPQLLQWEQLE
jgi:hypothetical protein